MKLDEYNAQTIVLSAEALEQELLAFLDERVVAKADGRVAAYKFYDAYAKWSRKPTTMSMFGLWMGRHLTRARGESGNYYLGVALRSA